MDQVWFTDFEGGAAPLSESEIEIHGQFDDPKEKSA